MASLAAAHKGYFYQDIVTAYFLARSIVEQVRGTTVDAKLHTDDRFDDLLVVMNDEKMIRRQFKHSDAPLAFEGSFLSSDKYSLRVDELIKSWQADPAHVRSAEYRVCVTWRTPVTKEDRFLLKAATSLNSFGDHGGCFHLNLDAIWPKRQPPLIKCLQNTKRADLVAFAKHLVIELECPRASFDLDHPGPMEQLLLGVLTDRVGFGRYPNHLRRPVEAAAQLILLAVKTRGADPQHSALSPSRVIAEIGLITDYGRIAQQFPFKAEVFVSIPDLRKKLLQKVKGGGITVLSGGPGVGKSWELTDLMKKLRAQKVVVAAHYCYLEPGDPLVQSRITLNAFYGNLMAEIIEAVPELQQHSPTRYAAGPRELQALLDAAGMMKAALRLVVVVDGLDHIERVLREARTLAPADTQIARDLLALKLPKNVSVLVGSQPGDHITQLAKSGTLLKVPAWEEPEVEMFLRRVPLGKKLTALRLQGIERTDVIIELATRSQGNALYCTYLCRELEARIDASPGTAPITLLRTLPTNDGKLSTYYEFLLESLDSGGRLIGELMGLIDFGVTPEEIQEIFPLLHGQINGILKQLAPILEQTRGQGGLRIYHESFRRHLIEKHTGKPGSLHAKLKDLIIWLDSKGFLTDPRSFRFLLLNLERAGREIEVLTRIERDFVIRAVEEGYPSSAIETNLDIYARIAADAGDFPKLVRAAELARALRTYNDNLSYAYEYGTTYAAIFGVEHLAERLSFDGVPTFSVSDGLKLCSFCADAGVSAPWHSYIRKLRSSENSRDMRAEMAQFHGRTRIGDRVELRLRLVEFLSEAPDSVNASYIASIAQRWAEVAEPEDLQRLQKESKCSGVIAEVFDLEFARRTLNERKRKSAATRVARRTSLAEHAFEALRLGAEPKHLTHWTKNLEKHEIGVEDRGLGEGQALLRWVISIRIAAYVDPKALQVEEVRTRGEGWYRNWLAFIINLARIECRATRSPSHAANDVVKAFRALASDVAPFKGNPRACDLYYGHGAIHQSFQMALGLLETQGQWREVIALMKKISLGTTTFLQGSRSGPLTSTALVELVAPFAVREDLHALIRSEIEPLVQRQHRRGLYNEVASEEMALASLLMTMGDRVAALGHWKTACLHLCAYGERKDITIYELLGSIQALRRAGKSEVLDRLSKLLPMVYAVVHHTDGKETRHSIGQWFTELFAVDELSAAWLLGRSMTDDGGSYDYRTEEALVHWLEEAGPMDTRLKLRLEQLVEGPSKPAEIRRRLERIELLRSNDTIAAELEFHLLAAAVHGDSVKYPEEGYEILRDFAQRSGIALAAGGPDIGRPEEKDNNPFIREDIPKRKSHWQRPKSPQALLRRLAEVLHEREISNDQILDYCIVPLVEWADPHRPEVEEILTFIARANSFGDRAGLLSGLGTALEISGSNELAALALTLAFSGHRGGGGWLSFGDVKNEDLLVQAFKCSRPVALDVLAHEMAFQLGNWGVTQHVIGFLGRHDDVSLATAMWDEARESMLIRLPGHESAHGPFLSYEPAKAPTWTIDDAALFLILARISHPERRRKTAAICGAAWLVQHDPTKCLNAFHEIIKASLSFTHQLWLLHILSQFEPDPFPISQGLATELNTFVSSGRFSTERLALMLLNRAKIVVTGRMTRNDLVVSTAVSREEPRRFMSMDPQGVLPKVAYLWPDFPAIVVGRFETIMLSDESHKERVRERFQASLPKLRKSHPSASLHGWHDELFADCLNETLTGLESHLWSKGEWDADIVSVVLGMLLPDAAIPARHYWSRRVRPSWDLPSAMSDGVGAIQSVPDGELAGWRRIAHYETYLDCESSMSEIKLETRVTTGVVLDDQPPSLPENALPLQHADDRIWMHQVPSHDRLNIPWGPLAGLSEFGVPYESHELLGLMPHLVAALELYPRPKIGPLDLFDKEGKLAVAYRWWSCRPIGDHGFADEKPKLFGGTLLMRPDLFSQLVAASGHKAFEVVKLNVENPAQFITIR